MHINNCLVGRLVNSRMKWVGHMDTFDVDHQQRMAYVHWNMGRRRMRGRLYLMWLNWIKGDTKKTEGEH